MALLDEKLQSIKDVEELLAGYSRLLLLIILQGGLFTVEVSSWFALVGLVVELRSRNF